MEQPGLCAGIAIDAERVVVLPSDMQAGGHAHQPSGAISFALLTAGFVLGGIPGVCDLLAFRIQRKTREIALLRSYHAPAPILRYDGGPVAGKVDGGFFARSLLRGGLRDRCRRFFFLSVSATGCRECRENEVSADHLLLLQAAIDGFNESGA